LKHPLINEEANVCATDMTQEGLDRVAASVGVKEDRFVAIPADITKREQVKQVVSKALSSFGPIHGLANVASASTNKALVDVTDPDMSLALNTGIWATFFFMQECYPHLKATGGSIVNFGSKAIAPLYSTFEAGRSE
jgi:NAD(P)-dependent dehydrogenase (short-subunit alcohol dehydrogenase family)